MIRIDTLKDGKRMSTQALLQEISGAVARGETDFHISASGQHDIGGPLWNREGKALNFAISNPGQRVGCMCLPNTLITVDGPVPADAGWLNSGGTLVVRGDAGDTAGHCAASGRIYIGGRAGTRSGSLMKHDPQCPEPELWILKSTGSFSFEFMSGGKAIVCGQGSQTLPSVLGERPCVGMVGGIVYFRGPCPELPADVRSLPLDEADVKWLDKGLDTFLDAISASGMKRELSLWKHWRKIVPASGNAAGPKMDVRQFHNDSWFKDGLFGDVLADDFSVLLLVATGADRLREPLWNNSANTCLDCRVCLKSCPRAAVKRRTDAEDSTPVYSANAKRCIGCGICMAVCPQKIWQLRPLTPE